MVQNDQLERKSKILQLYFQNYKGVTPEHFHHLFGLNKKPSFFTNKVKKNIKHTRPYEPSRVGGGGVKRY